MPMHSLENVARVLHIFLVFCLQRSIKRLQWGPISLPFFRTFQMRGSYRLL